MQSTIKSGFYYDLQKQNPLTSMTLHPNTWYDTSKGSDGKVKGWTKFPESDCDEEGYSNWNMCSAILQEELVVGIANEWSDFNGGDPIGQMWNQIKPMEGYMNFLSGMVDTAIGNIEKAEIDNPEQFSNKINSFVANGDNQTKLKSWIDKASSNLSNALVTQGTRFSYYGGTGISFGNMTMKFNLFADWIYDYDNEEGKVVNKFTTIYDQLERIFLYFMGEYVDFTSNTKYEDLNTLLGWQKAPGGFKCDVRNQDTRQIGTFKLKFGSYYSISNLVIRDVQLTFSKQVIKDPNITDLADLVHSESVLTPLYCEVQLSLQPAAKYTSNALRKFMAGGGRDDLGDIKKSISKSYKDIADSGLFKAP